MTTLQDWQGGHFTQQQGIWRWIQRVDWVAPRAAGWLKR